MRRGSTYQASLPIALALVCVAPAAHADPPGAAAVWHFDDGAATVTDASGNGNTGTFVGQAAYGSTGTLAKVPGNVGYLQLGGGTAHVSLPNSASLTMSKSFTATAWVRLDQQTGGAVLSKDTSLAYFTNYNLWILGNKVRTVVTFTTGQAPIASQTNGVATCDPGGCYLTSNALFVDAAHPLGTWRHVAYTWDDVTKTMTARLDCATASATFNTTGTAFTSTDTAQIGQRKSNGPEPAFVGAIGVCGSTCRA